MPGPDFLDTNVLACAYDTSDRGKQRIAQYLLRKAVMNTGEVATSSHVVGEFASTLLHKVSPPVRPARLLAVLDALSSIKLVQVNGNIVRRAVEARAAYGIHFYDGMIIAAAESAGCARIWSEDLNAGQKYFGMLVENPFRP
jgi:predicted nucleic acid-binding protein